MKKNQYKRDFLVAEMGEKLDLFSQTPTLIVISDLLQSVALYNAGKKKVGIDWVEHLKTTTNWEFIKNCVNVKMVDCGFSGSHFWLHDDKGERILFIYFLKVIIDTDLEQTEN